MNLFSIIGLVGRAGSGKDTVAAILADHDGYTPIALADALRTEVSEAFGVGVDCMLDREAKERKIQALAIANCADRRFVARMVAISESPSSPRSPRDILRLWGTEYRRMCDSDMYWIDRLDDAIDANIRAGNTRLVVTDCRFINEALFIHRRGGICWRIRRPVADIQVVAHPSEADAELIPVAHTINNDSSIGQLVHAVRSAARKLHVSIAA